MGDADDLKCDKCGQLLPKKEDETPAQKEAAEESKDTDGEDMTRPSLPGTGI